MFFQISVHLICDFTEKTPPKFYSLQNGKYLGVSIHEIGRILQKSLLYMYVK